MIPMKKNDSCPVASTVTRERVDVLLAEDDDDLRDALADTLEDAGYTTAAFANGQDALEWLQGTSRPPSLVLLDLRMPIMDGWQFRERQIKEPAIAGVPVVLLSAMSDTVKSDGVEHLKKPIQSGELLAVVARYCGPGGEQPA
jgi:CheY-like chemotaxis protein